MQGCSTAVQLLPAKYKVRTFFSQHQEGREVHLSFKCSLSSAILLNGWISPGFHACGIVCGFYMSLKTNGFTLYFSTGALSLF